MTGRQTNRSSRVTREIAPVLIGRVDRGMVWLLDLIVSRNHTDGSAASLRALGNDMNAGAEVVGPVFGHAPRDHQRFDGGRLRLTGSDSGWG